jgi:hypothetical protein
MVGFQSASAETIYGIANQGASSFLVSWDSASPQTLISSKHVSTVGVLGIDARPANGGAPLIAALLATGPASGQLYYINTTTGAFSTPAGPTPPAVNLDGFSFGFDFNPTIDRIRVTSDVDQNLVLNPNNGSLQTTATNLFYGAADPNFGVNPNIGASAYSNNRPTALTTQLYGIDMGLDILVTQSNNAGQLGTVGPLGVNVSSLGGFDISGPTGIAYATMTPVGSSQSNFYRIDLMSGAATDLGPIGGGIVITAMTIAPVPEPATFGLGLSGMLALAALRRKR